MLELYTRVLDTGEPLALDSFVGASRHGDSPQDDRRYDLRAVRVGSAVAATWRDVTDRHQYELHLARLASHDALTSLLNRAGLIDALQRALSAGRRHNRVTALLMIDLDHFKYVNDSLGHGSGDRLLQVAAARLIHAVRSSDRVARLGGDEFVVALTDLSGPTDAARSARRIVSQFRQPLTVDDHELYTTASVGVAVAHADSTPEDLLREADTAMYVAKAEGRDRISLFNEDLRATVTARLTLESHLRSALPRQELAAWYQPEVELTDGTITALEALVRWHHPSGQLYVAGQFIEVAEDNGLIVDIGGWMLRQACADGARWAERFAHRPPVVRVNLAALQLLSPELIGVLDEALPESGLDPRLLCAEITETTLLRRTSILMRNLAALRQRGIQIALDDFGTGFASLSYLRDFDVDVVKIDRSFVGDIHTDRREHDLAAGIIGLAHGLGVAVIAEGVETPEQAAVLRKLGCHHAQGFLYSAAIPATEIETLLEVGSIAT